MTDETIEPETIEPEEGFEKPLKETIKDMVKNKLENLMKTERETFLEQQNTDGVANSYCNRDWETMLELVSLLRIVSGSFPKRNHRG